MELLEERTSAFLESICEVILSLHVPSHVAFGIAFCPPSMVSRLGSSSSMMCSSDRWYHA